VTPGNAFLLASDFSNTTPTFATLSGELLNYLPAGAVLTQISRDPVNNNHAALLSDINSSPDFVNYVGHGNENTWGGFTADQNWLTNDDMSLLTNSGHPA